MRVSIRPSDPSITYVRLQRPTVQRQLIHPYHLNRTEEKKIYTSSSAAACGRSICSARSGTLVVIANFRLVVNAAPFLRIATVLSELQPFTVLFFCCCGLLAHDAHTWMAGYCHGTSSVCPFDFGYTRTSRATAVPEENILARPV